MTRRCSVAHIAALMVSIWCFGCNISTPQPGSDSLPNALDNNLVDHLPVRTPAADAARVRTFLNAELQRIPDELRRGSRCGGDALSGDTLGAALPAPPQGFVVQSSTTAARGDAGLRVSQIARELTSPEGTTGVVQLLDVRDAPALWMQLAQMYADAPAGGRAPIGAGVAAWVPAGDEGARFVALVDNRFALVMAFEGKSAPVMKNIALQIAARADWAALRSAAACPL